MIDVRPARTWDFFPCGTNVVEAAQRWAADLGTVIAGLGLTGERIGIE